MRRLKAVGVVGMLLFSVARPVSAGNGLPWFYFLGKLKIGPYPSHRICADHDGSCHNEHGPKCLPNPVGNNCAPVGPGFGVFGDTSDWPACLNDGRCVDLCSNDCVSEGYARGFYYIVVGPDRTLSLAGPFSKHACMQQSEECLAIGGISNTEGSSGGP
jgi:hypothetical protein